MKLIKGYRTGEMGYRIASFIKDRIWVAVKLCLLFIAVALFVSYNSDVLIGVPLAAAITLFSIIHWRIFDRASDAFF